MENLKIIVIINDKNKEITERYLESLSRKFKGKIYLIFMKDVDYYPAEILLEMEKAYDKIKNDGLAILNGIAEKAKQFGFDTQIIGVYLGISSERLKSIYESVNPDILIDLRTSY